MTDLDYVKHENPNFSTQGEIYEQLNDQQLLAIQHIDGPLLILAGAGTGKTKVLTNRIAHLISTNAAYPNNILAVTFTNKAATEMKERINKLINADGITVGTFHSVCIRILRSHISLVEPLLTTNFNVIDQDDQVKLIRDISNQEKIDTKTYSPKAIHAVINRWKDAGISFSQIKNNDKQTPLDHIAAYIYPIYQKQMIASNVMDFADILLYCNTLLIRNPEILAYYQNKFKYILIDEYQDTNAVQYVWARMLASLHQNICCVGDDDQSIYSWRGAQLQNILRFEKDFPQAKIIKLEQNYRSSKHILAAASSIIKNNKSRHGKTLWTDAKDGQKVQIVTCWNDKEEARFIAQEIEETIKHGKYSAKDIAILVRAGFQTRAFEEVFISNAIPYQMIGGLKFYDRKEIRDALAYIRLCINNCDNLALERIINVPKRGVGNVSLSKIKENAANQSISVFESIKQLLNQQSFKGKTKDKLEEFVELIELYHKRIGSNQIFKVTKELLEDSGYINSIKNEKSELSASRLENINEMLRAIDEYDNIIEFVEHASLVMEKDENADINGGSVKIMTLHAAKGLEFDLVFLPGWEEGIFPHQKALDEDGAKGLEEERRIAYVGITRAKKLLYITCAQSRRIFADFVNSIPSRFIAEIPDENSESSSSAKKLNYFGTNHNFNMPKPTQVKPKLELSPHRPGSKVHHSKFGNGIIIKTNGDNFEIAFERIGLKTIKKDYLKFM